jgi:hypothetical protein
MRPEHLAIDDDRRLFRRLQPFDVIEMVIVDSVSLR